MIKNISTVREEYDYSYWLIRVRENEVFHDFPQFPCNEVEECALLSYDYHDSHFSGWTNRQRMSLFYKLRNQNLRRGEYPF